MSTYNYSLETARNWMQTEHVNEAIYQIIGFLESRQDTESNTKAQVSDAEAGFIGRPTPPFSPSELAWMRSCLAEAESKCVHEPITVEVYPIGKRTLAYVPQCKYCGALMSLEWTVVQAAGSVTLTYPKPASSNSDAGTIAKSSGEPRRETPKYGRHEL